MATGLGNGHFLEKNSRAAKFRYITMIKCSCSWQVPDHEELSSMARILAEGLYQGSDQQDVYQIGSYNHFYIKGEV